MTETGLKDKVKSGEVINKQGQGEKWVDSRKFVITIAGLFLIALLIAYGSYYQLITKDNFTGILTSVTGVIGGYVIGQGYADGQAAKKG
jgi:hypothetical protein